MKSNVVDLDLLHFHLTNINDNLNVKCEISSLISSYILSKLNITYSFKQGEMCFGETIIKPHCWCEIRDNLSTYIIDYKTNHWLGDFDNIPQGIFKKNNEIIYRGVELKEIFFDDLPSIVFDLSDEVINLNEIIQLLK